MLRNGKNDHGAQGRLCHAGCSCHNSAKTRRAVGHTLKRKERKQSARFESVAN
jgi:hypothetical protein